MAKSQRSSKVKSNNQKLKKNVFGPVETERTARLSAKLLELASQPKAKPEVEMKDATEEDATANEATTSGDKEETMEVDSAASKNRKKSRAVVYKSGIAKRKAKKSAIVFPTRTRKQIPQKKSA